jgi:tetratricopeptide (TPR) repeat protein
MAIAAASIKPIRHPWLDIFAAGPVAAYGNLLAGYAKIHPYERADPPDAARMLFGPLPPDDPVRLLLGPAILGWLDARRRATPPTQRPFLQHWIAEICETFKIVSALEVADAATALRRQFAVWNEWTARFSLAPSRDAHAEYWRMLALTQPLVARANASNNPNDLAPLWRDICRSAGDVLPSRYLHIGLLGFRRIPEPLNGSDSPWVAGLAHWAQARNPTSAEFLGEWRALKPLYPRTPGRWRQVVGRLLGTAAFRDDRDALLEKWRGDADIAPMVRDGFHLSGERIYGPGREGWEPVIRRLAESWSAVEPLIDGLMRAEHRFLDATGDAQFFIRSMHRLGRALIQTPADQPHARARKAQALAREGLDWAPYDRHLWSLWREALAAEGAMEAAERVGWEFVRRDPDNPEARNQLATLLAEAVRPPAEAEALLRGTIDAFPDDVVARTQLAELAIATGNVNEAEAIVDAAFAAGVVDGATYALRARLQAHRGQTAAALATLREGMRLDPTNTVLRDYERTLLAGRTLPLKSNAMAPRPTARATTPLATDDPSLESASRFGNLRRLRAATDTDARESALAAIKAIFDEDPTFAYAELLAARHKLWHADAQTMPVFAVAFEQALVDEDRAWLDELAQKYDRMEALILVARALLGDEPAVWLVQAMLN